MAKDKTKNHNPNETNQDEEKNMDNEQSEMMNMEEEDWEQEPSGSLGGEVSDVDIIEFYQDDDGESLGTDENLKGDDETAEDEDQRRAA